MYVDSLSQMFRYSAVSTELKYREVIRVYDKHMQKLLDMVAKQNKEIE